MLPDRELEPEVPLMPGEVLVDPDSALARLAASRRNLELHCAHERIWRRIDEELVQPIRKACEGMGDCEELEIARRFLASPSPLALVGLPPIGKEAPRESRQALVERLVPKEVRILKSVALKLVLAGEEKLRSRMRKYESARRASEPGFENLSWRGGMLREAFAEFLVRCPDVDFVERSVADELPPTPGSLR